MSKVGDNSSPRVLNRTFLLIVKLFVDSATSPVQFNAGISIRFDLDAEKLLQLKNSQAEIKIRTAKEAR